MKFDQTYLKVHLFPNFLGGEKKSAPILKSQVEDRRTNYHGKSLLTPNRNPTYNMHYFVDILVITIG